MPEARDGWTALRDATRARIGLGRSGDAQSLHDVLAFQHAHARARDAVHAALDGEAVAAMASPYPCVRVRSLAADRAVYLRRPDLGRRLDPACLADLPAGDWDAAFIVADGLSAVAVAKHAARLFAASRARLEGWRIAPLVIATQARVALGDEIGAALGTALSVVLIGERPGLSVADSLGVYITHAPRPGRQDHERNCISNIHDHGGLAVELAADKLAWLLGEARRLKLTGVGLKDAAPVLGTSSSSRLA